MKDEKTFSKKICEKTKKVKKNFEKIKDLQMKGDGVNLPALSNKITHSGARLGLAGRSCGKLGCEEAGKWGCKEVGKLYEVRKLGGKDEVGSMRYDDTILPPFKGVMGNRVGTLWTWGLGCLG